MTQIGQTISLGIGRDDGIGDNQSSVIDNSEPNCHTGIPIGRDGRQQRCRQKQVRDHLVTLLRLIDNVFVEFINNGIRNLNEKTVYPVWI